MSNLLTPFPTQDDGENPLLTQTFLTDKAFLLDDVFSAEECDHYIAQAEQSSMSSLLWTQSGEVVYRKCDRFEAKSSELATTLWNRIKPFMSNCSLEIPQDDKFYGLGNDGLWLPTELNPMFRICRYYPGGLFAPHYDGMYVKSEEERSLYTCMLYLNDVADGGSTNILDENLIGTVFLEYDTQKEAEAIAERDAKGDSCILVRYAPKKGSCIIFPHKTLHEGSALGAGVKYIMRTDIVFKRVEGSKSDIGDTEREGLRLIAIAEEFERSGKHSDAVRTYKKAFKLCPHLELRV
eukprot:GILK01002787.1.p1 GENE.GILK01002787.1~~GILK01002787.1.p1  ORF type:complete len:313 (-),score=37.72 GILK01002787.1:192-1073(-)